MIRRSYEIKGFDCANCAARTERHLNKQENIESAVLDFAGDRLHIVYKNKELTVEELLNIIKEVETDEILLSSLGEKKKKTYHISGFNCANCAAKTERHLNKHPAIEEAVLDFAGDTLFVTYKGKELSIPELKKIIAEVEDENITVVDKSKKIEKKSIFAKDFWILLARVLFVTLVMVFAHTLLAPPQYFWYVFALYMVGILVITYDIFYKVINHVVHKENPIDEYLLISLSCVGAFLIATLNKDNMAFMDSLMVVALFQVGKMIESVATNKSKEAIKSAMDLRIEKANLLVDGNIKEVSPEELNINDLVLVTTGELIPVDAVVVEGDGLIDTSSLTGEFVPISSKKGLEVYSGCLVKSGTLTLRVIREYKDSAVARIIELISNSGAKKSKADEFVSKFARWYTPIVFIVAILVGVIGGAITSSWSNWAILGLKMLVVACPCAIVISVPMAYFSALGLASKNGIVVKGTNYLDKLVDIKKIVTDKTGTLTKGEFQIVKVVSKDEEQLLKYLKASEALSTHPIGKAICEGYELNSKVTDFLEKPGFGIEAKVEGELVIAGNAKLLKEHQIKFEEVKEEGTTIYCALKDKYLGYVILSDQIKEDAKEMVSSLKRENIEVILLTGDKEENAKYLANELGISRYKSELLPEEKRNYLEKELSKEYATGFVGDGINDAASIKIADVGFAMGAIGSDAAVESADVVIMTDHPSKVSDSIKIAKIARHTSIFNIVMALTIKLSIEIAAITTSLLGRGELIPMWLAVLADTGLTVLLVINSLLILYRKIKRNRV